MRHWVRGVISLRGRHVNISRKFINLSEVRHWVGKVISLLSGETSVFRVYLYKSVRGTSACGQSCLSPKETSVFRVYSYTCRMCVTEFSLSWWNVSISRIFINLSEVRHWVISLLVKRQYFAHIYKPVTEWTGVTSLLVTRQYFAYIYKLVGGASLSGWSYLSHGDTSVVPLSWWHDNTGCKKHSGVITCT